MPSIQEISGASLTIRSKERFTFEAPGGDQKTLANGSGCKPEPAKGYRSFETVFIDIKILDLIFPGGYIPSMAWNVEYTDEFESWWVGLDEDEQIDIAAVVGLLEEKGPQKDEHGGAI